jgi:hypothetical protein
MRSWEGRAYCGANQLDSPMCENILTLEQKPHALGDTHESTFMLEIASREYGC